jgi:hypothetical protein
MFMHKKNLRSLFKGALCFMSAFVLLIASCFISVDAMRVMANETNDTTEEVYQNVAPEALAHAEEVEWTDQTTAFVKTPEDFASAYVNLNISRIKLLNDIDITRVQMHIPYHQLNRSVQIDGDNYKLTTRAHGALNNQPVFNLTALQTERATLHFKNISVWTRGGRYIDSGAGGNPRTAGWQVVLDNVQFSGHKRGGGNAQLEQALRVASVPSGHVFLRNNVQMETDKENVIAGQITVEQGASVHAHVSGDASNWSFTHPNKNIQTVDNTVNIGEGASVELTGARGTNRPAIHAHWRTINVNKAASLHVYRPGTAYAFTYTDGMAEKAINVFDGATLVAESTGNAGVALVTESLETRRYPLTSNFYAAPGSTVKLNGKSSNATSALVHLRNRNSSFTLNRPAAYDIRNNLNRRGAKAVNVGSAGRLMINESDIAVWDASRRPADLNAPADMSWYGATLVANGAGRAVDGTTSSDNTTSSLRDTWQTTNYARISSEVQAPPTLNVKQSIVYQKNSKVNEQRFLQDVVETPHTLTKIESNFNNAVQLDTVGAYIVRLQGEDASGRKTDPVEMTVLIKDEHTVIDAYNDTMIRAQDFTVNIHEVLSADYVALAEAQAWRISTGEPMEVILYSGKPVTDGPFTLAFIADKTMKSVQTLVTNHEVPTLRAAERVYYTKDEDTSAESFLQRAAAQLDGAGTITSDFDTVVDMTQVGAYVVTIQGENPYGNKTNSVKTIVFVFDDNTTFVEDADVMMYAHDFTIDITQLPDADFSALAGAKAWDLTTGEPTEMRLLTEKPTGYGRHRVAFLAHERIKAVQATVKTDTVPFLNAITRMTYEVESEKTGAEFLADAQATLNTSGEITSDFESVVDMTQLGVYVVTIEARDGAGQASNVVQTVVLVNDKFTVIDETTNTMLAAQNFGIRLSEMPTEEAEFLALAKAAAWNIVTGEPIPVRVVTPLPTTAGMHGVVIGAGETMKLVIGAIVDDVFPTVRARDGTLYEKGVSKTEEDFLTDVGASLNKPGVIRTDFDTAVDLTQVGVYIVTLYGEDFLGGKGPEITVSVLVADENTAFDFENDIMVYGHDFDVPLADVADADFLALSEAKGWLISTGASIELTDETVRPTTAGTYRTRFNLLDTIYFSVRVHVIDETLTRDDTTGAETEGESDNLQMIEGARPNKRGIYTNGEATWHIMSDDVLTRGLTQAS